VPGKIKSIEKSNDPTVKYIYIYIWRYLHLPGGRDLEKEALEDFIILS
jgi:hypothetical protein